jgi:hypothetical protein
VTTKQVVITALFETEKWLNLLVLGGPRARTPHILGQILNQKMSLIVGWGVSSRQFGNLAIVVEELGCIPVASRKCLHCYSLLAIWHVSKK